MALKKNNKLKNLYLYLNSLSIKDRDKLKSRVEDLRYVAEKKLAMKILAKKQKISFILLLKRKQKSLLKKNKKKLKNLPLDICSFYKNINNSLLIKKLSNFLMIHGNKRSIMKIILKFFYILKFKYNLNNPLRLLRIFFFNNLVPVLQSKTVGFKTKKIIGVVLNPVKRLSLSMKIFIKGARMYNYPIVYGLISEFLKFFINKSSLQIYNTNMLETIKTNNLYKYLKNRFHYNISKNNIINKRFLKIAFDLYKKIQWDKLDIIIPKILIEKEKKKKKKKLQCLLLFKDLVIQLINNHNFNINLQLNIIKKMSKNILDKFIFDYKMFNFKNNDKLVFKKEKFSDYFFNSLREKNPGLLYNKKELIEFIYNIFMYQHFEFAFLTRIFESDRLKLPAFFVYDFYCGNNYTKIVKILENVSLINILKFNNQFQQCII